jgi:hypothetical protein
MTITTNIGRRLAVALLTTAPFVLLGPVAQAATDGSMLASASRHAAQPRKVTLGLVTVERGSAGAEKPMCTLATLKGRYLFATYGTVLPPAFGVTEPTPGASAGFHLFNGDGTGTDIVTVRIGSKITLKNAAAPISYTVNPDCTGSYTVLVPDGPSFDLFIAPTGDAFAIIATAPEGNYVSSIDERVSDKVGHTK